MQFFLSLARMPAARFSCCREENLKVNPIFQSFARHRQWRRQHPTYSEIVVGSNFWNLCLLSNPYRLIMDSFVSFTEKNASY
jgi:hypothetical protein